LVIKIGMKVLVCLVLAGALTMTAEAQSVPAPGSGDGAQIQSQDATKPAGDAAGQANDPQAQPTIPPAAQSTGNASATQTANPPGSKSTDKDNADVANGKVAGTSNDRLFYALPNFLTLQTQKQLPPMSAGDKFKAVALGTFDYVQYPWWGILAAISQATNGHPAYGQGWEAYAKRYGTAAGDSIVENFMVGAVFASVLREDPRYYQSGQGSFFRRTGYSISRIVVTRTDSGHNQFNYSEIFGAAMAAAISTYTYHPRSAYVSTPGHPDQFIPSERTFTNVASTWGTQIGLDTLTLGVKEFWPDIHRKLSKKPKPEADPPGAGASTPVSGGAPQAPGVKP
jgi:hypothetical protein